MACLHKITADLIYFHNRRIVTLDIADSPFHFQGPRSIAAVKTKGHFATHVKYCLLTSQWHLFTSNWKTGASPLQGCPPSECRIHQTSPFPRRVQPSPRKTLLIRDSGTKGSPFTTLFTLQITQCHFWRLEIRNNAAVHFTSLHWLGYVAIKIVCFWIELLFFWWLLE